MRNLILIEGAMDVEINIFLNELKNKKEIKVIKTKIIPINAPAIHSFCLLLGFSFKKIAETITIIIGAV